MSADIGHDFRPYASWRLTATLIFSFTDTLPPQMFLHCFAFQAAGEFTPPPPLLPPPARLQLFASCAESFLTALRRAAADEEPPLIAFAFRRVRRLLLRHFRISHSPPFHCRRCYAITFRRCHISLMLLIHCLDILRRFHYWLISRQIR
jgi:hypothetical protein